MEWNFLWLQHKFENGEWTLSPAKRFAYVNTDERQTVADLDPMKMRNLKCHGAFRISKRLRGDCKARLRKPIRWQRDENNRSTFALIDCLDIQNRGNFLNIVAVRRNVDSNDEESACLFWMVCKKTWLAHLNWNNSSKRIQTDKLFSNFLPALWGTRAK